MLLGIRAVAGSAEITRVTLCNDSAADSNATGRSRLHDPLFDVHMIQYEVSTAFEGHEM